MRVRVFFPDGWRGEAGGWGCIFKTGGTFVVHRSTNGEGNKKKRKEKKRQPLHELRDLIKEINVSAARHSLSVKLLTAAVYFFCV